MDILARRSFARGWSPDVDAVNAPKDALLRADNLTLDEMGIVAGRSGAAFINSAGALPETDVLSLYTAVLNGTRYRLAGAGNAVYAPNGASLGAVFAGAGEIVFGSHRGQILVARSTTKKKYNGATLANWGVSMTGGPPTGAILAADGKTFATCDNGEAPGFVANEGAVAQAQGQDGTANNSVQLTPNATTGRGTMTKTFAAATDFTAYDAGGVGIDQDLLTFYVYITEPTSLRGLTVLIDVNAASANLFQDDYYSFTVRNDEPIPLTLDTPSALLADDYTHARVDGIQGDQPATSPLSQLRPDAPVANVGWNKVQIPRSAFARSGSTASTGWSTVKAIRFVAEMAGGGAASVIRIDTVRILGGNNRPLTGTYKWIFVYVANANGYLAFSAPSAASSETTLQGNGARITAPADASRDSQVNEIWLYRFGGTLDQYYRVSVTTGVAGVGAVALTDDTLADRDALTVNLPLDIDITTPPDSIISLAGPYYGRTFALTATNLYPSRRNNPDGFSAGQVINVCGPDETALWVRKAFGGLFIGTTKDIYALEGDGAEFPDNTMNFTLRGLSIDHPPTTNAMAQEGNLLIYLADDGWRALAGGANSTSLVGNTSLLYRGQTRHGVSPVNLTTGHFSAAIAKGQLVCVTPEGASTTSSSVVYRYVPTRSAWYRHVYTPAFRCVYREPDGTLLAGDTAGFIWQLDTGTQDNGANIPIVLWTPVDDNDQPYARKDPWDFRTRLDTGGATASLALHLDGASAAAATLTAAKTGEGVAHSILDGVVSVFTQVQIRLTGSFSTFRFYDFGLNYRERPILTTFVEPKPNTPSLQRRRFSGLQVIIDTLGGNAVVTPILDGTAQTPITVNTSEPTALSLTFDTLVGRDLWATISRSDGFELYQLEPRITETLPPVFRGLTPRGTFGTPGVKSISGLQLRLCTVAVARAITPIVDGEDQTAVSVTSALDDPTDLTIAFPAAVEGVEVSFRVDGDIELYDWRPLVSAIRPLGVEAWDSGPLDLGTQELVWLREMYLKVRAGAALTVTPWFDGVSFPAVIATPETGVDTVVRIPVGRAYVGRQPRLVVTSPSPFHPYWIKVVRRTSGLGTQKPALTIPVAFHGGA